ncbi:MAG: hypothetical protein IJQ84_05625 [Paludibacteraceae bacterium]|nr:hypothetical protein [Paludibacteraceae bacterium]
MRGFGRIILFGLLTLVLFPSCEKTTFRSSVPTYPVHVVIDTRVGSFVHFKPDLKMPSAITLTEKGYFYDGSFVRLPEVTDRWGYGGVLVYINLLGNYDAYDLACPYCASKGQCQRCEIDDIYAICPHCGEHYDIGSGTAAPQKGIANEYLRRINMIHSDDKITVHQ